MSNFFWFLWEHKGLPRERETGENIIKLENYANAEKEGKDETRAENGGQFASSSWHPTLDQTLKTAPQWKLAAAVTGLRLGHTVDPVVSMAGKRLYFPRG